jgi:hypothetical protein
MIFFSAVILAVRYPLIRGAIKKEESRAFGVT